MAILRKGDTQIVPRWPAGVRPGALALLLMLHPYTHATAQIANEYEVKAAFLYKFASFIGWPENPGTEPYCIAVLGDDPFGETLDEVVKGKSTNGRPFVVKRFRSVQAIGACNIVFVSSSEKKALRSILERLQHAPVLTVSDMPGFCENGGIINFELGNDRIRLQINVSASERARLQVSSKLLSLAKIVHDAGTGGQ